MKITKPNYRIVAAVVLFLAAGAVSALETSSPDVPKGLTADDWQGIREAHQAWQVAMMPPGQQAYLKASNTRQGNGFGVSVAVSGDTVVVGAPLENSSTTGVNSTPNESAPSAGAAYVFTGFSASDSTVVGNISTRASVFTGDNVLIAGFILTGSAPEPMLVRAIGPTLTGFGVAGALVDPVLELYDGKGALIATNSSASP
jgi:hypothetical protein